MTGPDFSFKTMDELKVEIVKDRLLKFNGIKYKAAESLGIHVQSIDNILEMGEEMADKFNKRFDEQKKKDEAKTDLGREGWTRDPNKGHSVPVPLTPIPGIETLNAQPFKKNPKPEETEEAVSVPAETPNPAPTSEIPKAGTRRNRKAS